MKKIITTIVLIVLTIITVKAQVKPKISVNTPKVNKAKITKELKVKDSRKLKSINDFKKLNIPIAQVSVKQQNANSTKSWNINVNKLKDGNFRLVSARGQISMSPPALWLHTDNSSESNTIESGSFDALTNKLFPLKLSFSVDSGSEYRLKIRGSRSPRGNYIYVATKHQNKEHYSIFRIELNPQKEFNYVFQENISGKLTLYFSALPQPKGHIKDWIDLEVKEIQIDRIN